MLALYLLMLYTLNLSDDDSDSEIEDIFEKGYSQSKVSYKQVNYQSLDHS